MCIRDRRPAAGGDGHGQRVEDEPFRADAVCFRLGEYLFGHGHAPGGAVRDAVVIQRQGDEHSAVLLRHGEYRVHGGALAAHGVDQRPPVVEPRRARHGLGVGGVDLQRQRQDGLQFRHRAGQHGLFVDVRQAHVHVQNVRAGLHLLRAFAQHIAHVVFPQGALEVRLAGGVDALADEHRCAAEFHRPRVGADHRAPRRLCRRGNGAIHRFFQRRNVRGRCV